MKEWKKYSFTVLSIISLGLLSYVMFSFWFSMQNEVKIELDNSVETEIAKNGLTVTNVGNLQKEILATRNFSDAENIVVILNKEIFLFLIKEMNTKQTFYAFEEKKFLDEPFLVKKYWALLPNGILEFEQTYAPEHSPNYRLKEYNEERAIFKKNIVESFLNIVVIGIMIAALVSSLAIYVALSVLERIIDFLAWLKLCFWPKKE